MADRLNQVLTFTAVPALGQASLPYRLGVQGVAAPSANLFGSVSPTTAAHVRQAFPNLLVLDGGACDVGIESTIVDCSRNEPMLLRPGMLSQADLSALCGQAVLTPAEFERIEHHSAAPRASGTLASHYAPAAPVRLMSSEAIRQTRIPAGTPIGLWARTLPEGLPAQVVARLMPADPALCARLLFALLREFEALGVAEIWIESPPQHADWDGIRDRLSRAAAPVAAEEVARSLN